MMHTYKSYRVLRAKMRETSYFVTGLLSTLKIPPGYQTMPNNKKGYGRKSGKKSSTAAANERRNEPPSLQRLKSLLPTFHEKQKTSTDPSIETGGLYATYKQATLRYHNWMAQEACPNSKMSAVNDYRRAMQLILDKNWNVYNKKLENHNLIVTPPDILASLSTSIRLREKVTAEKFGSKNGGDAGHRYIIDVLKYCKSALRFANRIAAAVYKASYNDEYVQDEMGGRFFALALDDDEEELEDEMDITEENLPKYNGVEIEADIDIHQALLEGGDRFQTMALLYTMDNLMGVVRQQYQLLKDFMREHHSTQQASTCMHLLLKCAAVANMAIDSVNRAEMELMLQHPHISSFYHVLALAFMTEYITGINIRVSKTKLERNPHMALEFVAEILMERNNEISLNKTVKQFIKQSGLDPGFVEETMYDVRAYAFCQFEIGRGLLGCLRDTLKSARRDDSQKWLYDCENIGGDFCIINTHTLVQWLMNLTMETPCAKPGVWGRSFDENSSPARRVMGDLDELLVCYMVPDLLLTCKSQPLEYLSDRTHLITVLDLFGQHLRGDRTKPMPAALAFGLHAILMSVFVLQGDGDLARIAAYSQQSHSILYEQLQTISDCSKSPENTPLFYENLQTYGGLSMLAKPIKARLDSLRQVDPVKAEMFAFWNPLIGGEVMLYSTYMCSLGMGAASVNSIGQLRFVLHLYNGLRLRDTSLRIPLLEKLDNVFKESETIWVIGMPERGSCCKNFLMSRGINDRQAALLASIHAADKDLFSADSILYGDYIRR